MRSTLLFLLASLLLIAHSGCAARAPIGADAATPAWADDLAGSLPADAGYAFLLRPQTDLAPMMGMVTELVEGVTLTLGPALQDPSAWGVDTSAGLALYGTSSSMMVVVRLADPTRFSLFLKELHERTGLSWSSRGVGHAAVYSSVLTENERLDFGLQGTLGFLRVTYVDVDDDADAAILSLLQGHRGQGWLLQSEAAQEILQGRPQDVMHTFAFFSTGWVDTALQHLARSSDPAYQPSAACVSAADGLRAALPWFGFAGWEESGTHHADVVLPLRSSGLARAQRLFRPAPVGALQDDTIALGAVGSIQLGELAMWLREQRSEWTQCGNAASLLGILGTLHAAGGRGWEADARLYTGTGAFALYNFRLMGLIPMVEGAVMATTSDPPAVLERIQRMLRQLGSQATVVEDAAITTIEHRVLMYRLRLMQTADRFLVVSGDAPRPTLNALALDTAPEHGPFFRLVWRGERLRPSLEALVTYAGQLADLSEADLTSYRELLDGPLNIESLDIHAGLNDEGVRVRFSLRRAAPLR